MTPATYFNPGYGCGYALTPKAERYLAARSGKEALIWRNPFGSSP
jgi:hypothetical protein